MAYATSDGKGVIYSLDSEVPKSRSVLIDRLSHVNRNSALRPVIDATRDGTVATGT